MLLRLRRVTDPVEEVDRRPAAVQLQEVRPRPREERDRRVVFAEPIPCQADPILRGPPTRLVEDEQATDGRAEHAEPGHESGQLGVGTLASPRGPRPARNRSRRPVRSPAATRRWSRCRPGRARPGCGTAARVGVDPPRGGESPSTPAAIPSPISGSVPIGSRPREIHRGGRRTARGGRPTRTDEPQGDRLADPLAGLDRDRERQAERGAEGLERGVDPVPLVLRLEQVSLELQLGPQPRLHLVGESAQLVEGLRGATERGNDEAPVVPSPSSYRHFAPAHSRIGCSTQNPIRLRRNVVLGLPFHPEADRAVGVSDDPTVPREIDLTAAVLPSRSGYSRDPVRPRSTRGRSSRARSPSRGRAPPHRGGG